MKILFFFGIRICYLVILIFLVFEIFFFPLPFHKGKLTAEFIVADASKDTTFQYRRFNNWISVITKKNGINGMPLRFTIRVTGNVDNETEVYLRYVGFQRKAFGCLLQKGEVNTIFQGELYEDRAEIIFLHKKSKAGNLKLLLKFSQEEKNHN